MINTDILLLILKKKHAHKLLFTVTSLCASLVTVEFRRKRKNSGVNSTSHLFWSLTDALPVPQTSAWIVAWSSPWFPGAEPGTVNNGRPPAGIQIEEPWLCSPDANKPIEKKIKLPGKCKTNSGLINETSGHHRSAQRSKYWYEYLMRREALQSIGMTQTAVNHENMLSVCCQEVSKRPKVTKFFKGDKTESSKEASKWRRGRSEGIWGNVSGLELT